MRVLCLDGQLSAIGHRVAGIDREVDDCIFELVRIGFDRPQARGEHGFHFDRFPKGSVQQL